MGYIYKIENTENGMVYIGQTKQKPQTRLAQHLAAAQDKNNIAYNYPLQKALRDYDHSAFVHTVLGEYPNGELNVREMMAIKEYDSYFNGYNQSLGGTGIKFKTIAARDEYIEQYIARINRKHLEREQRQNKQEEKTVYVSETMYDAKEYYTEYYKRIGVYGMSKQDLIDSGYSYKVICEMESRGMFER